MNQQTRNRRRWVRSTAVVVAVAAGGVGGAVALDRARPEEEVAAPVEVVKAVAAQRIDLSADATLDGTVENRSTLSVVHRIEGATPTTASSAGSAQPETDTAIAAAAEGIAFMQLQPASVDETDAPTTSVAEPTVPDSPTTVDTTAPETTAPETTAPAVPSTTIPSTTAPDPATTASPSTAAPDATATTQPTEPTVSGGRGTVGGALPSAGGLAGGSGSGSTSGSTTTSVTERITSLPALGASIELGNVLYTVDGRPVVAMAGALPAWRSLSTSSDDGADIAQLELSLVALGYDADGALVVDNEYDSTTADAVEAWQAGLGLEATGEVELGDVVYLPNTVTVTALHTSVGADVTEADPILDVSGVSQQVIATVTDDVESVVVPGLEVQLGIEGGPVTGVVTRLRSVSSDDGISVEAVIAPGAELTGQPDGSALDVTVALDGPTDAITVPADAVVSKLDGTYAVQVRDESGDRWVVVQVLDVRGSTVAVDGLADGTEVLVPA